MFGLSFGLTTATLGWYMTLLPPRRILGWASAIPLGMGSVAEVALITMQTWRGAALHFNDSSPFDGMVFQLMGVMVALVGAGILLLTLLTFRAPLAGLSSVAVRAGLLFLICAQAIGAWMIAEGSSLHRGAGAIKVPHALGMHGLQVLPFVAWLLARSDLDETLPATRHLDGGDRIFAAAAAADRGRAGASGRTVVQPITYAAVLVLVVLSMLVLPAVAAIRRRPGPAG